MTDANLAAIEARADAATLGPWWYYDAPPAVWPDWPDDNGRALPRSMADACFMAHAQTRLPRLLGAWGGEVSVITNNKQRRLIPAIQERAKMKSKNEIPVVVCTEKRGVFFGYLPAGAERTKKDGALVKSTELVRARMCQYWSAATRGVLGLASIGPQAGSRVGPPVPRLTLRDPTCFVDVTPEAVAVWESSPWA